MKRAFEILFLIVCVSFAFTSCYRTAWSCTCYTKINDSITNTRHWDFGEIQASKASDMCRARKLTPADTCFVMGFK